MIDIQTFIKNIYKQKNKIYVLLEKETEKTTQCSLCEWQPDGSGYLDYTKVTFQLPYEAGCRMMVLYAISYAAHTCNG